MTMHAYDDFVDFLVQSVAPRALAQFHPSEATQHRVEDLRRRERSERLSPEEKTELQRYDAAEHLLRLARARFQQRLTSE